jgi:ribosomal protein S18 acetylase RimI-like enzyme
MRIVRLRPGDEQLLSAGAELFDDPPTPEWTEQFLARPGHHLLFALGDGDEPVGFVSGVETMHPDKGTEMFLYELDVAEAHRNQAVGRSLVAALADLARELGCYGMWVATDADNAAALRAYGSAGAGAPEPFVMLSWKF